MKWPALIAATAVACASATASSGEQPNILMVIGDDIGVDAVGTYGLHPEAPATPTLDSLAAQGVRFTNAYTSSYCSPSRAMLLTGQYSGSTGFGFNTGYGLDDRTRTIADVLADAGYYTFAVGKWHLAPPGGSMDHPNRVGFHSHQGTRGNVGASGGDFFCWPRLENGETVDPNYCVYLTTSTVDDTLDMLSVAPEPWFAWVAFHAAHAPHHVPPVNLHSYSGLNESSPKPDKHRASVQALDTELARLMAQIDMSDTTVIFLGDNGTPNAATTPPFDDTHGKGTIYQGGVKVPMIVAGYGVDAANEGTVSNSLLQSSDVYATIVELTGIDETVPAESKSFVPMLVNAGAAGSRTIANPELFDPQGFSPQPRFVESLSAIDGSYKVMQRDVGVLPEMYDISTDIYEGDDLLSHPSLSAPEQAAYDVLSVELFATGCNDGVDNDLDGNTDFPADLGCKTALDRSELHVGRLCDDGVDADGDGLVDLADPDCVDADDTSEGLAACSNGIDDDGDGDTDWPSDAGCSAASDDSEREIGLVCDDGVDQDFDGQVDFPADVDCTSPTGPYEVITACNDEVDSDGDGLVDLDDPGCLGDPFKDAETDASLVCDDGIDGDGDGEIDFPADIGCKDLLWHTESPACSNGLDDDNRGDIDHDGGFIGGTPDPQCVGKPWRDKETHGWSCGLGFEFAFVLLLPALRRRGSRLI